MREVERPAWLWAAIAATLVLGVLALARLWPAG
jgi:hypothetical protein